MWKNGDSLVNNIDQNKLSISLLTIGLIWIGFLYFLTDFDLYNSTLGQATVIENYKPTDQNFEKIQTNNSELLSNIYYQIEVGNIILPIMISSYGNPILNLNFDNEEKSIMLVISPLNAVDNKLLIDIPRTILDSKANGNDKNFTVMVDELPAKFLEITNSSGDKIYSNSIIDNVSAIQYSNNTDSRLLMIEFNSNSKIIKITGTDTSNLDKKSQINDSRTDHTSSEDKSQYNIYVPIISIAVAFGIIVFYFLYRNNKLRFMKKLRS